MKRQELHLSSNSIVVPESGCAQKNLVVSYVPSVLSTISRWTFKKCAIYIPGEYSKRSCVTILAGPEKTQQAAFVIHRYLCLCSLYVAIRYGKPAYRKVISGSRQSSISWHSYTTVSRADVSILKSGLCSRWRPCSQTWRIHRIQTLLAALSRPEK